MQQWEAKKLKLKNKIKMLVIWETKEENSKSTN
jgi:hypothetical protein